MALIEVKAAELVGPALDWAVAKVEGVTYNAKYLVQTKCNMAGHIQSVKYTANYLPSADWAQGGPLLDKYDIALNGGLADGERVIYATLRAVADNSPFATAAGPTRLIAICRAVVGSKLGYVVQVPADLVGVAA